MKMSGGVEWALHCCVALTVADAPVSAAKLAELHDVSSSYLAKLTQLLAKAGLVSSAQGKRGGYALMRDPDQITVLDVVLAVEGPAPAFQCTEIRQRGPLAAPPEDCASSCAIAKAMIAGEAAWRAALRSITIGDLARQVGDGRDEPLGAIRAWLGR